MNMYENLYIWRNFKIMFEFDQYLGFLVFLGIATIGFWLMIFLLTFVVPYWVGGAIMEAIKEKREARKAKKSA
ncbi:conserved hypothetical protein [Capnocytophaga canis]|uniref:Uncharacterized protein n=3 Tax=Capnocytophaga canis TaxID=1848903 RepID=A0A0B7ING6_9FLAO|nr:conserved hypothetical protein [Capnocytophaga canis]